MAERKIVVTPTEAQEAGAISALTLIRRGVSELAGQSLAVETFYLPSGRQMDSSGGRRVGITLGLESPVRQEGSTLPESDQVLLPLVMTEGHAAVLIGNLLRQGVLTREKLNELVESINQDAAAFQREPPIR